MSLSRNRFPLSGDMRYVQRMIDAGRNYSVLALYRFQRVDDPAALQGDLKALCGELDLCGTLIVAREGINGTVAGSADATRALLTWLGAQAGFTDIEAKFSTASDMPFLRMKVRFKREIVTMGLAGLDPAGAGAYVEPAQWNRLIADPETIVVDTRNDYEVALGRFEGAVDPGTAGFTDFPAWAASRLDEFRGRKVAMYCTGGIRCEKATAYLRGLGVEQVFHLKGGILKYLEEVPAADSAWQGECFVFDERVSVGHGLAEGDATLCRACRHPLTEADRAFPLHEEGVACVHCHGQRTPQDRARYRERHRQVELAQRRGRRHIGS